MNDLQQTDFNALISDDQFSIQTGSIVFPEYDNLMLQAKNVYQFLSAVEVTPESVKQSKKLVANVNKAVKRLEDRRIAAKKTLLEPYQQFEKQIKEITGILNGADRLVRDQVNRLEDSEKEGKLEEIARMFGLKIAKRDRPEFYDFDAFMDNRFLNKTYSIQTIEINMAEWFKLTDSDVIAIETLDASIRNEVAASYMENHNFADSMIEVQNRRRREEAVRAKEFIIEKQREEKAQANGAIHNRLDKQYIFTITDPKDAKLTKLLLKENNINFTYEER